MFHRFNPYCENYLRDYASIGVGQRLRGYTATIWTDGILPAIGARADDNSRYINGREQLRNWYGETFTETDLWSLNVPTIEEYAEWISIQAHAFMGRLLAPAGMKPQVNYLRAYTIDVPILRLLGVRYLVTDATEIDGTILRATVSGSRAPAVHLYELDGANVATYSPTRFVVATSADEIVRYIRENKTALDVIAVVSEAIPPTESRAHDVIVSIARGGVDVHATSDGQAHVLLPIQFSHCLVVANGAPVQLRRANLMQTLMSFQGAVDAELRFRFGLFQHNGCRLRDAVENKWMGLP
jgi:hypothetical protein